MATAALAAVTTAAQVTGQAVMVVRGMEATAATVDTLRYTQSLSPTAGAFSMDWNRLRAAPPCFDKQYGQFLTKQTHKK